MSRPRLSSRRARRSARMALAMLRGSLLVHRSRVVLAVAAIAIGTSVAAALLLVSTDVGSKVARELRTYGPNLVLAPAAGELPVGARDLRLGAVVGEPRFGDAERAWLEAERSAGRLNAYAALRYEIAHAGDATFVTAGTDLEGLSNLYPAWRFTAGTPPAFWGDVDALIGARAAEALGVTTGGRLALELVIGSATRPLAFRNVAVVETGGTEDRLVFVRADRLPDATRFHLALARATGSHDEVLAYAAGALPAQLSHDGAALRAIKQLSAADGEVLRRLRLLLITVTLVALVAALVCAMSTLADIVLERTGEFALLRALGAGRGHVLRLLVTEAVAIGLLGGLAGTAIGIVAAQAIGLGVFGSTIRVAPTVPPLMLVLGVATALVASLVPLRHALTIEPARVLRGE